MKYVFIILLLTYFNPAFTQSSGIITGNVMDEKKKPLEGASVTLLSLPDSGSRKNNITDKEGEFSFTGLPNGYYRLRFTYVGFLPLTIDSLHIREERYDFNLSDILLKVKTTANLNEVIVYAEKPLIQSKEGNITFNAGESALSAGSNASELLNNVPLVTKDPDGKLLVRGKEPKILIDDKPVELNQQQLQDLLESLPGSSIEKIEVMTNPPPQYANEQGGVINITTRKGKVGKSGRITLTAGTRGEFSINSNYNYRKQGFSMNINGGAGYNEFNTNSYARRQNISETTIKMFETQSASLNRNIRPTIRANVDYELDKSHSFNFVMNYNQNRTHNESNTNYLPSYQLSQRTIDNQGRNNNTNSSLTYTLRTKRAGEVLRFILNGSIASNVNDRNYYQQFLLPDYTYNGRDSLLLQAINNKTKGLNYRLSYDVPLNNKKTSFSLGTYYNTSRSHIQTEADYKQQWDGKMATLTALTYAFRYQQNIHNGRVSIKQRWSETMSTTAGLSTEYTNFEFAIYNTGKRLDNHYWSYLPFATFNKNWKDVLNLTASYRRTVRRPGYSELNPIVDSSDLFHLRSGNPSLMPSLTNNFDIVLGTTKKKFYANLGFGLNTLEDVFNQVRTTLNDSTTQTLWQNSSGKKEYEASTWSGYTFNKKIRLNMSASYTYNVYSGFDKAQRNFKNGGSLTSNLNTNYTWSDLLNATGSFTFNRFASPQGTARSSLSMNIGLQAKLLQKKMTATVNIIDPLRQQQNRTLTYGKNFILESFNATRSRNIRLTIGYIFNQTAPKKNKLSEKERQNLKKVLQSS